MQARKIEYLIDESRFQPDPAEPFRIGPWLVEPKTYRLSRKGLERLFYEF